MCIVWSEGKCASSESMVRGKVGFESDCCGRFRCCVGDAGMVMTEGKFH